MAALAQVDKRIQHEEKFPSQDGISDSGAAGETGAVPVEKISETGWKGHRYSEFS